MSSVLLFSALCSSNHNPRTIKGPCERRSSLRISRQVWLLRASWVPMTTMIHKLRQCTAELPVTAIQCNIASCRYNATKAGLRGWWPRLSLCVLTGTDGEGHPEPPVHRGRTVQQPPVWDECTECTGGSWTGERDREMDRQRDILVISGVDGCHNEILILLTIKQYKNNITIKKILRKPANYRARELW